MDYLTRVGLDEGTFIFLPDNFLFQNLVPFLIPLLFLKRLLSLLDTQHRFFAVDYLLQISCGLEVPFDVLSQVEVLVEPKVGAHKGLFAFSLVTGVLVIVTG